MRRINLVDLLQVTILTGKFAGLTVKDKFMLFLKNTDDSNACWIWPGKLYSNGYGNFSIKCMDVLAHRVSYAIHYNVDPCDMCVCHRCDNRKCINPTHLFLGTQSDNMRDMVAKNRSKAKRGESSGMAKLTAKDVSEIRMAYATGGVLQRDLANKYGVSAKQISVVVNGVQWRHMHGTLGGSGDAR